MLLLFVVNKERLSFKKFLINSIVKIISNLKVEIRPASVPISLMFSLVCKFMKLTLLLSCCWAFTFHIHLNTYSFLCLGFLSKYFECP